ncbi:unnamed protein product [Protopolystoma xenopodis]|uniref:PUM-HD domain-containing protein n=1 Tax=Protopolystoma xenopodis TaxID=117903 RepID=A0A3S5BV35_9PLAT|nr:unnamed protein product [Protopolystoma xenopodis]
MLESLESECIQSLVKITSIKRKISASNAKKLNHINSAENTPSIKTCASDASHKVALEQHVSKQRRNFLSLSKRERRTLKLNGKKFSEAVIPLLSLWEKQRCDSTPKDEKFQLIEKMLEIAKGKLPALCMAHDTSRIIESLIQHGTEAQRWQIYGELRPHFLNLMKSRYASYVVLKIIKYGDDKFRKDIFKVPLPL